MHEALGRQLQRRAEELARMSLGASMPHGNRKLAVPGITDRNGKATGLGAIQCGGGGMMRGVIVSSQPAATAEIRGSQTLLP